MIKQATPLTINEAAEILNKGGLVAFPTETVFGLGGDATNDAAVAAIYEVKNRPRNKAFSIMVRDLEQAKELAVFDDRAMTLAQVFWPGPVSMVLPLRENSGLSATALAGQQTISLRMPKHPVALQLLKTCNKPLAVPSANSSGHLSATMALDVARDLGARVGLILADGTPVIGIESTIIDLTQTPAIVLREGAIGLEEIINLIGETIVANADEISPLILKTRLRLNAVDVQPGEALLGFGSPNFIGVKGIGFVKDMPENTYKNLSAQGDLHEAAANLYTMLQALDECGVESIAVMRIPESGLGIVINNRLQRVAGEK